MTSALDRPVPVSVLTEWNFQPIGLLLVLVLAAGYVLALRRLPSAAGVRSWSRGRSVTFAIGLLLLLWTTCGAPAAYADSLFWAWTGQALLCWLVVPVALLFGHPLQLARAVAPVGTGRVLTSRPVRILANPYVATALVPALSFVIFFGPLPNWATGTPVLGWLLQVALLLIGACMVLWLIGLDDDRVSTLAAGMALGIGMFELVIDALPGIVMRLSNNLVTTYFDVRTTRSWAQSPISDQRTAGSIIWFIAEVIDLPFLLLAFRRWRRVDAHTAARVDAVLEAERSARNAETDEPWWLSDPAMQQRLKRRG